ncbi:MAG: SEC-C domain-containing protein [Bacteriovoracales bacterium]|nr:SEC-C domain-containing protein [Bacteriovoracales bacterium]
MEGPLRNSPCPCGSGKKYKSCCLGKVITFPKQNGFEGGELKSASEMLELAKEALSHKESHSFEEMEQELAKFYENQNSLPRAPFLGLSSKDMHNVLYKPFSLKNDLFEFKNLNENDLQYIPIMKQAFYFLKRLGEVGELKATKKGNLPKSFVIELYRQFFSQERYARQPNKEDDLPSATRLKHLLDITGMMKKRLNKYSLTQKGKKILLNNSVQELFSELTLTFFNKWNWAYEDYYSELPLIQSSVEFNLCLLHKKAQDWILDKELGEFYLNAFPALLDEAHDRYFSPEEEIIRCFSLRFLDRICLPMGLLLSKNEGKFIERKTFYKVSPFFQKNVTFHV